MSIYSKFIDLINTPEEKILSVEGLRPGIKMFESRPDFFEVLNEFSNVMKTYFNSVVDHVIGSRIIYEAYAGESAKIQEGIQRLDKGRNMAHNAAIAQVKMLNRVCEALGKEKICELDVEDRTAVNAFIFAFCSEMYMAGSEHLRDFEEFLTTDMGSIAAMRDPEKYLQNFQNSHKINTDINVENLVDER